MPNCLFILLYAVILAGDALSIEAPLLDNHNPNVEEGQKKLIQWKSEVPRYGECWKTALDGLEKGCKVLTDNIQGRMALSFTNCFLDKLGLDIYPCSDKDNFKKCTKNLDQKAFIAYTEFFTHTQSICFYLQSQIWQEETGDMIGRLTMSSAKVLRELDDASDKQEKIIVSQENLLNHGSKLNDYLEHSKSLAREMFDEFKDTTAEQRLLISDVFERVSKLQSFMLDEFAGFYSIIFYVLSVVVIYLVTSSSRTSGARLWLFALITFNYLLERFISSQYSELENIEQKFLDNNGPMYTRIWICRKVSFILCILALFYHVFTYRDLNAINNNLLKDIKRQMDEMANVMSFTQIQARPASNSSDNKVNLENEIVKVDEYDSDSDDSFTTVFSSNSKILPYKHGQPNGDVGGTRSTIKYNLRNRSVVNFQNPILAKEDADSFAHLVKTMSDISYQTSQNISKSFIYQ